MGELVAGKSEVSFPKIDASVFETLLRYIYTGNATITEDNYFPLLRAADEFGIEELKNACFDVFVKLKVTAKTVCSLMLDAKAGKLEVDGKALLAKCNKFFAKRADKLFFSDEVLEFDEDMILSLVQMDSLRIEEIDLWNACMRWGNHQLKKPENKDKKLKDVVEKIIPHIRYPLMTSEDLYKVIKPSGLVSKELYSQAMEFIAGLEPTDPTLPQFRPRGSIIRYAKYIPNYANSIDFTGNLKLVLQIILHLQTKTVR